MPEEDAPKDQKKTCFVIAPIGEEGSPTRVRSDQVLRHIIEPTVAKSGYQTVRADKISKPGIITSQIIQHLVDDSLVVADLAGYNPNVFYELGIRHTVRKPVIQLIEKGQAIPFDVAGFRTIEVDHRDLDSVERCRHELEKQIGAVEREPSVVETPVSAAMAVQSLIESRDPLEKGMARVISTLEYLREKVEQMSPNPPWRVPTGTITLTSAQPVTLSSSLGGWSASQATNYPDLFRYFANAEPVNDESMKRALAAAKKESKRQKKKRGSSKRG